MEQNNLPIKELKEYGIINKDNSFSQKLSENDVQKFLKGYIIVADNEKDRITFQLTNNNSQLKVKTFQRDKRLDDILKDSKGQIQYSKLEEVKDAKMGTDYSIKVFVAEDQKESGRLAVKEYDLFRDMKILTKIVTEKIEKNEVNRYKVELLKLMSFIQDKIDKFPELGKQLTENLNIVSNEVNAVNSVSEELNKKAKQSKIEYDVNDSDLYQDANRKREEDEKIEQEVYKGRRR